MGELASLFGISDSEGVTPRFPHSIIFLGKGIAIKGGLVDGPVYASIFNSLKGIRLPREINSLHSSRIISFIMMMYGITLRMNPPWMVQQGPCFL